MTASIRSYTIPNQQQQRKLFSKEPADLNPPTFRKFHGVPKVRKMHFEIRDFTSRDFNLKMELFGPLFFSLLINGGENILLQF